MYILNAVLLTLPIIFIVVSVALATKSVRRGKNPKRTVLAQLASFAAVFAFCVICPAVASAATNPETAPQVAASLDPIAKGIKYLSAALSTGIAAIGGGIAVGKGAPAAIGAAAEDPKNFGKSIIFVALGEGFGIYGMLVSILILNAA